MKSGVGCGLRKHSSKRMYHFQSPRGITNWFHDVGCPGNVAIRNTDINILQ